MKKYLTYLLVLAMIAFVSCKKEGKNGDFFNGDKGAWDCETFPELARMNNSDYHYVTHTIKLGNKTVRNFTLCYDYNMRAAHWVAYPLHKCYIGSENRSEAWDTDPDIPSSYQVGTGGYSTYPFTRGHQIPSADRTATAEMNIQTFYMSNMTPQDYDFNGGIWAGLESRLRSKYMCKDTLYVVTGAYWEDGTGPFASDGTYTKTSGNFPVPTHYYKLLLRSRSGNTGKTLYDLAKSDIICVGFWLDHGTAASSVKASDLRSVADIEAITGFDYFAGVDVDKTQCNPSDCGY